MLKLSMELDSNSLRSGKVEAALEQNYLNPSQELMRRLSRQGLMLGLSMERNTVKLHLVGKFKASGSAVFKELLNTFLSQGYTSFVFDLSSLHTLDGAGVAALVWARNQAEAAGGHATVTNPNAPLYRRLVSVNFHHLVPIENFVLSLG